MPWLLKFSNVLPRVFINTSKMVRSEVIDSTIQSWYQFGMLKLFSTFLVTLEADLRKLFKNLNTFFLLWADTPARVPDMAEPYGDL